jgi:hypothetical protein
MRKINEKVRNNINSSHVGYETTDMFLAGFLLTKGFELENVYRDGRRAIFVFRDHPDRKEIVNSYFNGAQVKAIDFVHSLGSIKTALFNL